MERLLIGTTHLTAEQLHDVQRLRDFGTPVKQVWERLAQYGDSYAKGALDA